MKLRHLLRRLLPGELQALAEKIESLDPIGCDEDRSWLLLHVDSFLGREGGLRSGFRWHERRILEMEVQAKYREIALYDAMALVMRVPSGEDWPYGRTISEVTKAQMINAKATAAAASPKVVLRRKTESV